jgi:signal transduction histidine kinase
MARRLLRAAEFARGAFTRARGTDAIMKPHTHDIDTAVQEAAAVFFGRQREQLRATAEAELKHLSFLSHDLNNNLGTATLHLKLLRRRLADLPEVAEELAVLERAQAAIDQTTSGMRRMLAHARLRAADAGHCMANASLVDVNELASGICTYYRGLARVLRASLSVQSQLGVGSTFSLSLPRHAGLAAASAPLPKVRSKGISHGITRTN